MTTSDKLAAWDYAMPRGLTTGPVIVTHATGAASISNDGLRASCIASYSVVS